MFLKLYAKFCSLESKYNNKIPYPGVKAVLDNAITPLEERAELGVRPNPEGVNANQEEAVATRAAKLASTNIIDWKVEQKDDLVLYQVVKHLRAPRETFKEALLMVLDKKATIAYVKAKEQLLLTMASCIARPISGLPRRPSFSLWCLKGTAVWQWTVATVRRHTKANAAPPL